MTSLRIDAADVRSGMGERVFRVRHHLTDHPLLSTEALAALADFLPERNVEHNRGDQPVYLPDGDAARLDLTPGEIARTIDTNGCWMVLKHVEAHPLYRALLDELLDEVEQHFGPDAPAMRERSGFVFLSAAGSVTPAHIDPEYNLLLQVRGTKTMTIGTWGETAEQQAAVERYYMGATRNILEAEFSSVTVELAPGDGVHVPLWAPHWVENGPTPSVSLSITFRTDEVARLERVHSFNAHLRKLGVDPRPPGRARAVDAVKSGVIAAWEATRGRRRKQTE